MGCTYSSAERRALSIQNSIDFQHALHAEFAKFPEFSCEEGVILMKHKYAEKNPF